jgi:peptidase E
MTKFVLHGGFSRRDNELNTQFFEEFARDIKDKGIVLMIFFASREALTIPETFADLSARIAAHASGKQFEFMLATKEDLVEQVKKADALYLHGGSTNKLLSVLRTYPDLRPSIEGKTVAGSSAGAYAIAAYGASHSESAMREGMGWAPLRVVCHYESTELPPDPAAVESLMHSHEELELVFLPDCASKTFTF